MQTFQEIFENLAGEWKLSRQISSGETFIGKACFEILSKTELLLSESGQLKLENEMVIDAARKWRWTYQQENHLMVSYHETSQLLYHDLSLEFENKKWSGHATHLCSPDTYLGKYTFGEKTIEIEQKISGPKKKFTVSSLYHRPN